jgi:hypothetical protein
MIIQNISDIDPLKKLTLSEFSYSRIDTYEMCPSKYFYSYIKKEPRMFSAPAVLRKHRAWCVGGQRFIRFCS